MKCLALFGLAQTYSRLDTFLVPRLVPLSHHSTQVLVVENLAQVGGVVWSWASGKGALGGFLYHVAL